MRGCQEDLVFLGLRVFFFKDTAPTEIYTLSLHDALPILRPHRRSRQGLRPQARGPQGAGFAAQDRKSGSAGMPRPISYDAFCLKKKKPTTSIQTSIKPPNTTETAAHPLYPTI